MRTLVEKIIQHALNCYITLDPESKKQLVALQGKIITIELLNQTRSEKKSAVDLAQENFLNISGIFQFIFSAANIEIIAGEYYHADTRIMGTPLSLLHMTLARKNRGHFFAEDIIIEGDLELGQQVINLFDELDIDWEEYLSHWLGDIPAHQISRLAGNMKQLGQRLFQTMTQNIQEYAYEEANFFPAPEALEDFYQSVDILREDTDRLAARIAQITIKIRKEDSK